MSYQPKSYRKFLATATAAALVATAVAPAALAATPTDIEGQTGEAEILRLLEADVLSGYADGFRPGEEVQRRHAAIYFTKALQLEIADDEVAQYLAGFDDVNEDSLYAKEIAAAVKEGIINGTPAHGSFNPTDSVTRQHMAVYVVAALGLENTGEVVDLVDLDDTLYPEAVKILVQNGISIGSPTADGKRAFLPQAATTRGQLAAFVVKAMDKMEVALPTVEEEVTELAVESVSAINSQGQVVSLADLPVNGTVKVSFSEKVNKETVNVNNFRVFEVDGNIPVSIPASNITLSKDGLTANVSLDGVSVDKDVAHKLVVKNVTNTAEEAVTAPEKTVEFTTSTIAVVESVTKYVTSGDTLTLSVTGNNANTGTNYINVDFDEKLSSASVTTNNVSLIDLATGNKLAINLNTADDSIIFTTDAALIDGKQYKVEVTNVKTATGENAETYTSVFAVAATTPLLSTVKTLDGTTIAGGDDVIWSNLASGTLEDGTYKAGLQLQMTFNTKLDETTIEDNVQLVEKETETVVPATVTYNADAKIVTVVPNADLKESTVYDLQVKGNLKSDKGIYLDATKLGKVADNEEFTTYDLTSPIVESVTSLNGDSDLTVSKTQEFTVKFSEDVTITDGQLIDSNTLTGGKLGIVKAGADLSNLSAGDVINEAKITIVPVPGQSGTYKVKLASGALAVNQAYKLVVIGKDNNAVYTPVADASSNTLKRTYVHAFTTEGEDVIGPKVTSVFKGADLKAANEVSTATNVTSADSFTFLFNEEFLDTADTGGAANVDQSKVKLQKFNGTTWVDVSGISVVETAVTNTAGDKVGLTVSLSGVTVEDVKYRLVVGEGTVKDAIGNRTAEDFKFEFIGTEGDDAVTDVQVSFGSVAGGSLSADSNDAVAVDSKLYVGFDEDEIFEVASSSLTVTDKDGNVVEGTFKELSTTVSSLKSGKQYVFTPDAKLANSMTYSVTVDGVTDLAGNKIAKKVISFKAVDAGLAVSEVSIENNATSVDRKATMTFALNSAQSLSEDGSVASSAVTEDGVRLVNLDTNTTVSASAYVLSSLNTDNKNYTIEFLGDNKLDANTRYKLEINPNGANNTKTVNFTTGLAATDDVKPTVSTYGTFNVSFSALGGFDPDIVNDIATADSLALTFSEGIKNSDVEVTITNVTDDKVVSVMSTETKDSDTDTTNGLEILVVNTVTDRVNGKIYKYEITGVKDSSGNFADTITFYVK